MNEFTKQIPRSNSESSSSCCTVDALLNLEPRKKDENEKSYHLTHEDFEEKLKQAKQNYIHGKTLEKGLKPYSKLPKHKKLLVDFTVGAIRGVLLPCRYIYRYYCTPNSYFFGPDEERVYKGLRIKRNIQFGEHEREYFDCFIPDETRFRNTPNTLTAVYEIYKNDINLKDRFSKLKEKYGKIVPILFIIGGGWVIEGSDLHVNTMTSWVREGHVVFIMNYPLAPENKYSKSLSCTLRALQFIKKTYGFEQVKVVGESAGANLAATAIAHISNQHMLKDFITKYKILKEEEKFGYDLSEKEDYPKINSLSIWYGVLDGFSWRATDGNFLHFEVGKYNVFKYGVHYVLNFLKETPEEKVLVLDFHKEIEKFDCKEVQVITSGRDPLGLASCNVLFHDFLRNLDSQINIEHHWFEEMTHGSVSFPPQVQKYMFWIDVTNGSKAAVQSVIMSLLLFSILDIHTRDYLFFYDILKKHQDKKH
eukprot:snap_masked-scaffold_1-processed-gene-10.16-mRNA-1 protein AED:1.00 eAED:1.00 QI:0/0/0/0/1/1/2/0/477